MNQSTYSAVPFAILRKLQLVRQRKLWVQVATAFVAAVAVLLAAMAMAMLVDWLATLYDSRWRVVLTTAALSAAALTSVGWLVVAWRRLLGLERIAGDVDRRIPQLAERWTTMTRLGDDVANPEIIHPAMLRRVASEASSWEPHVEPEQMVSMSVLMRAMLGVTAITAVLAVAVVLDSRQTLVLMRRFWLPASSISATELVNVPGNVVVGRGEPLALAAAVKGTPVDRAILFLRSEADDPKTITLVSHAQDPIEFSHRVRAVEQPFEYRFRAGDGQTDWFTVDVADRPEIGALALTITPPAYTGRPAKTFDKLPQRVSALQKSGLEFALRPKAPVERVELRFGNDKGVSLKADAEGWFRWNTTLEEGFTLSPVLTESHGLTNRRIPKCQFTVYTDKPPAVKVLTPDDQFAVRPDDTIQITFSASDDVGIGTAELLVYDEAAVAGGEPVPLASMPIPLGDQQGARSIQQTVDLDLNKFMAEDGAELSYEIRVREDRGGGSQSRAANRPGANLAANPQTAASPTAGNRAATPNTATPNTASNQSPASDSASKQPSASTTASNESPKSDSAATPTPTPAEPPASQTASSSQIASSKQSQGEQPAGPTAPRESGDQSRQTAASDGKPASAEKSQTAATKPAKTSPDTRETASNTPNAKPKSDSAQPTGETRLATNTSQRANSDQAGAKPIGESENKPATNQAANSSSPQNSKDSMKADEEPQPRTASTGRQSLSANRKEDTGQQSDSMPRDEPAKDPAASAAENSPTKPTAQQQASESSPADKAARQASKQTAAGDNQASQSGEKQSSSPSDPPPGDSMPRRGLDVAQTSSSQRMRLKVDKWAGSFEGQQRAKLEMAISPDLEALDKSLEKAQRTARGVLDELEADKKWRGTHDREVAGAERSTVDAQSRIERLQQRTKDTPYAFIGLQVVDIGLAHVGPARTNFWKAMESEGDDRVRSVRDAWQHLGRARALLKDLRGQYERTRREFQLAERMERVKKMYQVYLENSQALLEMQDRDPTRYGRKMVEFELDEEYLKRLKEVLEMRRDLRAELARILADDPRLLRRFMDSLRYRSNSLREELADLVADQADLNREVRAWTLVDDADRPRIAKILLLRQVQDAAKIATAAGELQSRYQTWLPLDRESKDPDLAAASRTIQEMATAAGELNATAQKFVAESQRVTVRKPPATADGTPPEVSPASPAEADAANSLDNMLTDAQALYNQLNKLEVALRQIAAREEGAETALFAANRLVDTRRLIADTSAWVRQLRAHKDGNYPGAAEVDQYRLAMKTDELAGKLGTIEQTLAALMQREDGSLPEPIAEKAREFITTLDREVSPNQLASVYALHSNQLPRANDRQKAAGDALVKAEHAYDDLMRMAIEELDKLPVQDPVADLLDDPTLDELLAQLEQELPIQELLGIPQRPSNLRIIGDWLRPGGDNAIASGGGAPEMIMNQMRQDQERARQQLNQAYQRAIARALKESTQVQKVEIPKATKLSDWNRLVSKLGDDLRQGRDKAPPEEYRRAIEQYFSQISRVVAENEEESP